METSIRKSICSKSHLNTARQVLASVAKRSAATAGHVPAEPPCSSDERDGNSQVSTIGQKMNSPTKATAPVQTAVQRVPNRGAFHESASAFKHGSKTILIVSPTSGLFARRCCFTQSEHASTPIANQTATRIATMIPIADDIGT